MHRRPSRPVAQCGFRFGATPAHPERRAPHSGPTTRMRVGYGTAPLKGTAQRRCRNRSPGTRAVLLIQHVDRLERVTPSPLRVRLSSVVSGRSIERSGCRAEVDRPGHRPCTPHREQCTRGHVCGAEYHPAAADERTSPVPRRRPILVGRHGVAPGRRITTGGAGDHHSRSHRGGGYRPLRATRAVLTTPTRTAITGDCKAPGSTTPTTRATPSNATQTAGTSARPTRKTQSQLSARAQLCARAPRVVGGSSSRCGGGAGGTGRRRRRCAS